MVWPGHFPRGLLIHDLIGHIDIMPMILHLLGEDVPPTPTIQELIVAAKEQRRCGQDIIYNEVILENRGGRCIREGKYKLIYGYNDNGKEATLLFDLDTDPMELSNIYQEKPEIAARLLAKLNQIRNQLLENQEDGEETVLDHHTSQKLRALGYLQ
jgi:arylsulfatase A-like enzyme